MYFINCFNNLYKSYKLLLLMLSKNINSIINKYITFSKPYIQELKEFTSNLKNDIDSVNNKYFEYGGYYWTIKYSKMNCYTNK